ncbi:MAG TPA: hypothetical protein VFE29_05810 [Terriglobia bacterium]|nr:hypothetical protein [Terriglobia bacterium]
MMTARVEDKKGKSVPYGFDFGAASVLLPGTSVRQTDLPVSP